MEHETDAVRLTCSQCRWATVCDFQEMTRRLIEQGKLRRNYRPDPKLLVELFTSAVDRFACPKCQATGLRAAEVLAEEEDDEAWGMARLCQGCKKPIPPQRLEIFPDEKLCVKCKEAGPKDDQLDQPEFCPACGGLMEMRQSRSAGISRYVMACSDCRRKSR